MRVKTGVGGESRNLTWGHQQVTQTLSGQEGSGAVIPDSREVGGVRPESGSMITAGEGQRLGCMLEWR